MNKHNGSHNGALRVLVVGVGNMGASHARAYDKIDGFELAGLCARTIAKRTDLPERWSNIPRFSSYAEAPETPRVNRDPAAGGSSGRCLPESIPPARGL